jgi:Fe-S oxidoreductase
MGPLAITLILLLGLAGFGYLCWRKLAIVAALQPEVRWDNPGRRLGKVLSLGFLQSRMIAGEFRPGVMHAVIFLGFMTLLVRKVQLLVIGYSPTFVYPGLLGGLYASLKDLVEVAVTVAVLYAFWRRFVLKPRRLEPNREALVVLSLILTIMVTDFLFDGFRFALLGGQDAGIAHEQSFAFVGAAIASSLAGLSPEALNLGHHAFYWIQMLTVFSFLVLLPWGEHFHIVTALPAVFFSRDTPLARVPSVDLEKIMSDEAGDDMKVGVTTAADLVWKDAFDAFTCTECGRCKDACPTFLTDKPLALKWVHDGIKHHLLEKRETIVARKADELPPLVGNVISEDTLWACTTCGYCEHACPIELEHLGKFFRMRQHQVMMEGAFPAELKTLFDNYESAGNPWGLPADTRADWARGLDVLLLESPEQAKDLDYLFYVGSAQSFDDRSQKVARAFVRILRAAGLRFAILGPAEGSTGECVRRAGNEMLFQTLAQSLVETLNGMAVTRIVTCDPHAFNSLKNEYPEFGGRYEVVHHTQLIDRLIREGRIRPQASFEQVIYHEPCYLGRHNGEYEAPRRVLATVCRDAPLEFPLNRTHAMCCGAGGGRFWMEEHIGRRINVTRVEQALPQQPRLIATACPYCTTMIRDATTQLGCDEKIATRDIAELVAEAIEAPAAG